MVMQAALPQIRPISDLRTRLNDIENLARESREPIIMTKNGTASLIVIDSDAYDEHLHHVIIAGRLPRRSTLSCHTVPRRAASC